MIFPLKEQILELHHDNIELFGGSHGIRDEGAFESALMAAENRFYYEEADVVTCAATYGFHLSQAHALLMVTSESQRQPANFFSISMAMTSRRATRKKSKRFSNSRPVK